MESQKEKNKRNIYGVRKHCKHPFSSLDFVSGILFQKTSSIRVLSRLGEIFGWCFWWVRAEEIISSLLERPSGEIQYQGLLLSPIHTFLLGSFPFVRTKVALVRYVCPFPVHLAPVAPFYRVKHRYRYVRPANDNSAHIVSHPFNKQPLQGFWTYWKRFVSLVVFSGIFDHICVRLLRGFLSCRDIFFKTLKLVSFTSVYRDKIFISLLRYPPPLWRKTSRQFPSFYALGLSRIGKKPCTSTLLATFFVSSPFSSHC